MSTNRKAGPRVASAAPAPGFAPLTTALIVGLSLISGLQILVSRGRIHWPPTQLLASLYTVAGCLAMVGPILLIRKPATDIGLGELVWLTGGCLIWVFDAAALVRGETRTLVWSTPLAYQPMGLTIMAVAFGAWRGRESSTNWSWTNVIGWSLGIFWVAMAGTTLLPARTLGLALR